MKIIISGLLIFLFSITGLCQRYFTFTSHNPFPSTYFISIKSANSKFNLDLISDSTYYKFKDTVFITFPFNFSKFYSGNKKHHLIDEAIKGIRIENSICEQVSFAADSISVSLSVAYIKKLVLSSNAANNSSLQFLDLFNSKINNLRFFGIDVLDGIYAGDIDDISVTSQIDSIQLINCKVFKPLIFSGLPLPKEIVLSGNTFEDENSIIDLTSFKKTNQFAQCSIRFDDVTENISRIKLNYENFRLDFGKDSLPWQKERLYKMLLEQQIKLGYTEGHEKLDKEYKAFEYSKDTTLGKYKNILDRWWWDYGYDRLKVITNSFIIFGLILLLNLLIYPGLLSIYCPEKFKNVEERLSRKYNVSTFGSKIVFRLVRIPSIIVYTAYLFWGVNLEVKEIELKRPIIFILIVLEYIAGIICLAYIANYVINT